MSHENDAESGLHYANARYLNTDLSIFLSVGPMFMNCLGLTPYNYCGNNPVMLVDPDGRIVFDPKVIVGIYVAPHFIGHYLYKQIENNTTREFSSLDLYSLYRSGRGTNVTLSQIGLLEKVQYAIDNSEKSKPKITGTVRSRFLSQIVGESQICDNPSNFSLEFKESYKFGEVNWAIGSATLKGTFKGGVTNNEDGTKHIKGTITYTFYDVFTDPYDIPNVFPKDWNPDSKSYEINETWTVEIDEDY